MLFSSDSIVSYYLVTFCSPQIDVHGQYWYWSDHMKNNDSNAPDKSISQGVGSGIVYLL